MSTNITDKTSSPPGVLPHNIRFIILAAIAILVLLTSLFSGRSAKRASEQAPQLAASGSTPNQLSMFSKMLSDQQRAAEQARREVEAARLAEEQRQALVNRTPAYAPSAPGPGFAAQAAVDPFEQERRKREELAPFASNIALSVTKPEDRASAPLISVQARELGQAQKSAPDVPAVAEGRKNTGSGKYLPEKENGFYRVYEGTMVETTLANRLDGSFTGPVRCLVSQDVRSSHGEALLIPKGALFTGEARRVESAGQSRLAVVFKRLRLPNGYSIDLENAPGLTKDGETGLKGKVNNHYLRTFGLSGAIGLLGGLALYGGHTTSGYDYAAGVASAEGSAATTALNRFLNLLPTITIPEGHTVNVYLPADLLVPQYDPNGKERN